jgi:hypothetical protein
MPDAGDVVRIRRRCLRCFICFSGSPGEFLTKGGSPVLLSQVRALGQNLNECAALGTFDEAAHCSLNNCFGGRDE